MSRLDAGAMKVELSNFRDRRSVPPAQDRIRAAGREEGVEADLRALLARGALGSPAAAPPVAEPRSPTRSNTPATAGCWSARAVCAASCGWRSGTPAWAFRSEKQKSVFREFERLDAGAAEPGPWPRPVHRRAHGARARPSDVRCARRRQGIGLHGHGADRGAAAADAQRATRAGAAPAPVAARRHGRGRHRQRQADRGRACARCCRPGAARRSSPRSQREAIAELARQKRVPDAILADYHLDEGDGVDAIVALRWRFGASLPAALITADRSRRNAGAGARQRT